MIDWSAARERAQIRVARAKLALVDAERAHVRAANELADAEALLARVGTSSAEVAPCAEVSR